jgi:hypothetical protein
LPNVGEILQVMAEIDESCCFRILKDTGSSTPELLLDSLPSVPVITKSHQISVLTVAENAAISETNLHDRVPWLRGR